MKKRASTVFVNALLGLMLAGGAAFGSLALSGCAREPAEPEPASATAESVEAPDFTLKNPGSTGVTLSSFRGVKPVIVVFWATWCPFCLEEMPSLVALKEKHGGALEILAVDIDESPKKVAAYAKAKGLNFPVLIDEGGEVAAAYGVIGIPTLVLVDREGKIAAAGNSLSPRFTASLEKLL